MKVMASWSLALSVTFATNNRSQVIVRLLVDVVFECLMVWAWWRKCAQRKQ
jgi:hypothetical protein